MRAITHTADGSADVLSMTEGARPVPSGNEVRLRVHAAGMDRAAWHIMTGKPHSSMSSASRIAPKPRPTSSAASMRSHWSS